MSKNDVVNEEKSGNKFNFKAGYEDNEGIVNEQKLNKNQKSLAVSSVTMKIINDESLVDCLAMYSLSEQAKYDED